MLAPSIFVSERNIFGVACMAEAASASEKADMGITVTHFRERWNILAKEIYEMTNGIVNRYINDDNLIIENNNYAYKLTGESFFNNLNSVIVLNLDHDILNKNKLLSVALSAKLSNENMEKYEIALGVFMLYAINLFEILSPEICEDDINKLVFDMIKLKWAYNRDINGYIHFSKTMIYGYKVDNFNNIVSLSAISKAMPESKSSMSPATPSDISNPLTAPPAKKTTPSWSVQDAMGYSQLVSSTSLDPSFTGTVLGDRVNVRSEPNTKSGVLMQFNKNAAVIVIGRFCQATSKFYWYQVVTDKGIGWIYGEFLSVSEN